MFTSSQKPLVKSTTTKKTPTLINVDKSSTLNKLAINTPLKENMKYMEETEATYYRVMSHELTLKLSW